MSASLQIPTTDSSPGPSRQHHSSAAATSRPVSVTVHSSPPSTASPSSKKHRASHQVVSSTQAHQNSGNHHGRGQEDSSSPYTDVYNHPAAVAYAAAHPRRTIPKFGPYLLLQTLGEGEFGKVKLGLHCQWGEEVAVKLIRRGNVDSAVRMSKVEREIEVLRTLKHPNIVRLYDVIETDKYIGIIIEYASGGELFDHILAHRYLRERDAAKLFSQLISGVWYIHQKKIVHRDLKLENLLLDRHRNVIITDFGFANRFEHRADDLMQTSCGSPCYAAPELVISEGLYVGSAVDIWSCGVILYAMLAGYLPFDDDPANPDGDNINLLYKYIVNTPLSFPDYISEQARDLLSIMLVPDPSRRASLESVMRHPWLAAYQAEPTDPNTKLPVAFGRTVEELEKAAMDQHHQKRLAYQKQMKAAAAANAPSDRRAQSHRPEMIISNSAMATTGSGSGGRSASMEPTAFYETPAVHTASPGSATKKNRYDAMDDDPFAGPGMHSDIINSGGVVETPSKKAARPHTVQVEYDSSQTRRDKREKERGETNGVSTETRKHREKSRSPSRRSSSQVRSPSVSHQKSESQGSIANKPLPPSPAQPVSVSSSRREQKAEREPSDTPLRSSTLPSPKSAMPEPPSITLASPPDTPIVFSTPEKSESDKGSKKSVTPASSQSSRHKRDTITPSSSVEKSSGSDALLSPSEKETSAPSSAKKSRRNTLTVMVEPISRTIKNRTKGRNASTPLTDGEKFVEVEKDAGMLAEPMSAILPPNSSELGSATTRVNGFATPGRGSGMQASTNKAVKVMQWFRNKSKTGEAEPSSTSEEEDRDVEKPPTRSTTPTQSKYRKKNATSSSTINQTSVTNGETPPVSATPSTKKTSGKTGTGQPQRTPSSTTDGSSATPSFVARFRNSVTVGSASGRERHRDRERGGEDNVKNPLNALRIHHGPLDQETITTRPPPEVMKMVKEVLLNIGMEIQVEGEFKYKCVRPKKKRVPGTPGSGFGGNGLAAFAMSGSAASNGVDKRGLPIPSNSGFSGSGNTMLRMLMRRNSSQVSQSYEDESFNQSIFVAEPGSGQEPLYGDPSEDAGDEVKFSVELTRLDRLADTYSLDIRRMKGNLRSYKFLYDTIRRRAELR